MVTGGIMLHYPTLRLAFSHGGGSTSALLARLQHAWKIFSELKETVVQSRTAIAKAFYFGDLLFNDRAIEDVTQRFGAMQICAIRIIPSASADTRPSRAHRVP